MAPFDSKISDPISKLITNLRYERFGDENLNEDDLSSNFRVTNKILAQLDTFQVTKMLEKACISYDSKELKFWLAALRNGLNTVRSLKSYFKPQAVG